VIRLAKAAQADIRSIAEHTKTRFGAAVADGLAREIVATFRRLEHFPHLGRIGRRAGTREIRIAGTPFIVAVAAWFPYRER
jgi:plasmid stabilization system protein ParE